MTAFECLYAANIKLQMDKFVPKTKTKTICFIDIHSRYSFKDFNRICGDAYVIESLKDFRREIEKYVLGLQKYYSRI